jgi:hypothetical protein
MQPLNYSTAERGTELQRNMDLIRDLLRAIEWNREMDGTRDFYIGSPDVLGISGHSDSEVTYHLGLLINSGMIDGSMAGLLPVVRGLTWDGHEFLDNVRNDNVWSKVKQQASTVSGVGLKVLTALAESELKKHFGLN